MSAYRRCAVLLVILCGWLLPPPWAAPADAQVPGWRLPLEGPVMVVRPFQPPATAYGPGHRGVDLAGTLGQPVRAAAGGRVSFAGVLAGRGVVTVTHGLLRTTYEPVRPTVRVGAVVLAGMQLGTLRPGHAGSAASGGALLHWGLLRGRTYLDPMPLVRRGPSRLLPLDGPAGPVPTTATPADPSAARATDRSPAVVGSADATSGPVPTVPGGRSAALVLAGVGVGAAALRRTRAARPSGGVAARG